MKCFVRCWGVVLLVLFLVTFGWADQVLVLEDDFSGSLTDNWVPGRAADEGDGIHSLDIVEVGFDGFKTMIILNPKPHSAVIS